MNIGGVKPDETGQIVVVQRLISGVWANVGSGSVIKRSVMPNGVESTGYLVPHRGSPGTRTCSVGRALRHRRTSAGVSATLIVKF